MACMNVHPTLKGRAFEEAGLLKPHMALEKKKIKTW